MGCAESRTARVCGYIDGEYVCTAPAGCGLHKCQKCSRHIIPDQIVCYVHAPVEDRKAAYQANPLVAPTMCAARFCCNSLSGDIKKNGGIYCTTHSCGFKTNNSVCVKYIREMQHRCIPHTCEYRGCNNAKFQISGGSTMLNYCGYHRYYEGVQTVTPE